MEKQNALRAEAALKKREEAAKKRAEAPAAGDEKVKNEVLDRVQLKLEAAKKMGIKIGAPINDQASKKDFSEHF